MADTILLKGIRLFKKKDNQPDFVIAGGVITIPELAEFIKDNQALQTEYNGQKQIKIQVLMSQAGNPYIAVDTFVPTAQASPAVTEGQQAPDLDPGLPF